jgi:hypothetical protein
MPSVRYSLEDINKIKQNGFTFSLPQDTQELIMSLSKLVGSPDYIKTPVFQKKRREINANEPDWELIKQFKPTEKVKRTDDEELVQDIKRSMNKMTDKNYDTLRDEIFKALSNLENTDIYNTVLDIIFNLASSNRFYSQVYAKLYTELMEKSSEVFTERIQKELGTYMEHFNTIKNVDANEDYEAFCDNNKRNEERKALTEFFCHLMRLDVISVEEMSSVFTNLMTKVRDIIDNGEEKHTMVELAENIFILLSNCVEHFNSADKFAHMVAEVKEISEMKAKQHPGLSNKSLFKLMDVIDIKV